MIATQDDLHALSSSFSKLLKRGFGKGPETCFAVFKGKKLYVYIRNFMTPAEEILLANHQENLTVEFRTTVISSLSKELLQESSKLLGVQFQSFYQDWNYDTNSGLLLLVSTDFKQEIKLEEKVAEGVSKLIRTIGSSYHKMPTVLRTVPSPSNFFAVESKEVLLPLESLIYERGQTDLLYTHARKIKRGYWENKGLFEGEFNRSIEDIFILWDYIGNKKYIVFSFGRMS